MRELLYVAAAAKIRRQAGAQAVWEPFDPDKQYEIGNKVVYEGSSYLVYQVPPIGTLPTDTDYFTIICQGVGLDVYEAIFTAKEEA